MVLSCTLHAGKHLNELGFVMLAICSELSTASAMDLRFGWNFDVPIELVEPIDFIILSLNLYCGCELHIRTSERSITNAWIPLSLILSTPEPVL